MIFIPRNPTKITPKELLNDAPSGALDSLLTDGASTANFNRTAKDTTRAPLELVALTPPPTEAPAVFVLAVEGRSRTALAAVEGAGC